METFSTMQDITSILKALMRLVVFMKKIQAFMFNPQNLMEKKNLMIITMNFVGQKVKKKLNNKKTKDQEKAVVMRTRK